MTARRGENENCCGCNWRAANGRFVESAHDSPTSVIDTMAAVED